MQFWSSQWGIVVEDEAVEGCGLLREDLQLLLPERVGLEVPLQDALRDVHHGAIWSQREREVNFASLS